MKISLLRDGCSFLRLKRQEARWRSISLTKATEFVAAVFRASDTTVNRSCGSSLGPRRAGHPVLAVRDRTSPVPERSEDV